MNIQKKYYFFHFIYGHARLAGASKHAVRLLSLKKLIKNKSKSTIGFTFITILSRMDKTNLVRIVTLSCRLQVEWNPFKTQREQPRKTYRNLSLFSIVILFTGTVALTFSYCLHSYSTQFYSQNCSMLKLRSGHEVFKNKYCNISCVASGIVKFVSSM